jgi:hypothetical protein
MRAFLLDSVIRAFEIRIITKQLKGVVCQDLSRSKVV